jgi:predicted DNA-binding antitoxin AbrB/MazE fold protein
MTMSQVFTVIYKEGVFRPLEKVDLKENERVRVALLPEKVDLSERIDPARLSEVAMKYNLSPSLLEILADDSLAASLTLEDVLALNACVGSGRVKEEFDIKELCFREDIWDAE